MASKGRRWADDWEDQWEADKSWRFREAKSYEELARELIDGPLSKGMSATQRARKAWFEGTGKTERSHTRGIFLKEFVNKDPVLYVYLDSSVHVQEFTTKKEIYLARLASRGFRVSGLEFRLSKHTGKKGERDQKAGRGQDGPELAELSQEEMDYAENLADNLQEPLRSSFLKAMIMSMRREKANKVPNSQNYS